MDEKGDGIRIEQRDNTVVATLYGSLSIMNIKDVEDLLVQAINEQPDILGIDCAYLDFIDSYAINHIIKIQRAASSAGTEMIMFDVNETVSEIFRVININKIIKLMSRDSFEVYAATGQAPDDR